MPAPHQSGASYAELSAVEDRLPALPCEGSLDLAAKLVADTCHGRFGPGEALVAECEAMLARALA